MIKAPAESYRGMIVVTVNAGPNVGIELAGEKTL